MLKQYEKYSWAHSLPDVDENEIIDTVYSEVVVCGAGFSGCASACRASELGMNVLILEKGPAFSSRGFHIGAANSRLMRQYGIENDCDDLALEWVHYTASRADERLINTFLHKSEDAMNWLLDLCDKNNIKYNLYNGRYNGRAYFEHYGTHIFDGGATAIVEMLLNEAVKNGTEVIYNTPAVKLVEEDGKITGVVAGSPGNYKKYMASRGVILATGDIGGNRQMCLDLAPEALMGNNSLNEIAFQDTGDGHIMGINAGGIMQRPPFPCTVHPMAFSMNFFFHLMVDHAGRRFKNEDVWPQGLCMAIYERCPDRPWAYSIMDADWAKQVEDTVEIAGGMSADSVFRDVNTPFNIEAIKNNIRAELEDGRYAWQADTLEELAEKIGVPAETFMSTIERYNKLAEAGADEDFGKRPELMFPLKKGPFIALQIGGSLMTVFGGLMIDENMRVLNEDYDPIEGLYAVGNVSGGLYAVDYPLVIPGSSHGRCLTWGFLAGNHLSKSKQ